MNILSRLNYSLQDLAWKHIMNQWDKREGWSGLIAVSHHIRNSLCFSKAQLGFLLHYLSLRNICSTFIKICFTGARALKRNCWKEMLDVVVCTICGVMHIELSQFIIEYLVRRGFISNGEFSFFVLLVSYFRAVSRRSCNWLNWTELLKHCVSPDSLLQCNMETTPPTSGSEISFFKWLSPAERIVYFILFRILLINLNLTVRNAEENVIIPGRSCSEEISSAVNSLDLNGFSPLLKGVIRRGQSTLN